MFLCCVVYPETTRNFIYAFIAPCSNMSVTNTIIGKPPKQMQYCNDNQLQIKPSKYVKIVCIPWRELSFLTLYVMVEGLFKCCYTGRHFFSLHVSISVWSLLSEGVLTMSRANTHTIVNCDREFLCRPASKSLLYIVTIFVYLVPPL